VLLIASAGPGVSGCPKQVEGAGLWRKHALTSKADGSMNLS
jgi:hypothetical protein